MLNDLNFTRFSNDFEVFLVMLGDGFVAQIGLKPNFPFLKRKIILCPVPGLVRRRCSAVHSGLLPHWIHELNPTRGD